MFRRSPILLVATALLVAVAAAGCSTRQNSASRATSATASPAALDWSAVDQAMGRPATVLDGGVHRYGLPRSDLTVHLGDVALKPAFALGSYLAFVQAGDKAHMMGDLVLTEPEVSKVLGPLRQGGVEVTAIHNHLLGEVPKVMYVHVHGMGDPVAVAGAVKSALGQTGTPLGPPAAGPAPDPGLDTAVLDQALGRTGKATGGIYQYNVGRAERIVVEGTAMPAGMGVATVLNFQATSGGQAAVTGDYALVDQEVEPVVDALTGGGIQVTAIHSHSVADEPHLYYLHFFGEGDPAGLARTLRQALDRTNAARAS
jgi:hypothetical protein